MGHDYVDFAGRSVVFRDPMLNLVRCIMLRLAKDPSIPVPERFRPRLIQTLTDFYYVCNGVFTGFDLDQLLSTNQDTHDLLDFIDHCADFVVQNGPSLSQSLLNELVGDSDDWNCDVDMTYPLLGFGRLANLICGAEPCVGRDVLSACGLDELTVRMKQQRLIEHRQKTLTNNPMDRSGGSSAS